MSRFNSVGVTKKSGSLVDGGSEEPGRHLSFSSFAKFETDVSPHVRQNRNVLQRLIPAELPEHTKVSDVHPGETFVRDAMEVDYAREFDSRFIPWNEVSVKIAKSEGKKLGRTSSPRRPKSSSEPWYRSSPCR